MYITYYRYTFNKYIGNEKKPVKRKKKETMPIEEEDLEPQYELLNEMEINCAKENFEFYDKETRRKVERFELPMLLSGKLYKPFESVVFEMPKHDPKFYFQ